MYKLYSKSRSSFLVRFLINQRSGCVHGPYACLNVQITMWICVEIGKIENDEMLEEKETHKENFVWMNEYI